MTTETPMLRTDTAALDYYLLHGGTGDGHAAGLVVEEFVLADDLSAPLLRSAGWTPAAGGWWSSAAFARSVRADRRLRARLTAVDRATAAATYHRLGGGTLPAEEALRDQFHDDLPLSSGAPLRLGTGPDVHRVLFAGELDDGRLAGLSAALRLAEGPSTTGARPGVVGTGRLRVDDTNLRWDLRRVGGAWCIDVMSEPAAGDALRRMLRRLTGLARGQGLVPATVDRLS
ncbi:hypothetical protein [Micromonospora sp. NPDC093277]|uniref:hypothetical protein n=1 Tax=Micromonospora sp. NPDC093277 TaxID=3364291 RepID=UPI003829C496